jgi:SAM-dependent methyltransferase
MSLSRKPAVRLSRDDIVAGYRLVLGRDPESEAIVNEHLVSYQDLWSFIAALFASVEAQRRQVDQAAARFVAEHDARRVDVDTEVAPGATTVLLRHIEAAWSKLGQAEPYWSVLTDEGFRSASLDEARIEGFYATGAEELEAFEAACVRNSLPNTRQATVLDLGCGVGRVGEHFARAYEGYIGVDISPSHLDLARQRFSALGLTNAKVMLLADFLAARPQFDVFFSVLALQHSPPPVMQHLLQVCLGRLQPGGYAFFQIPCHLYDYEFRLTDYLNRSAAGAEAPAAMEMHALPQGRVFRTLADAGLVPVEVLPYPRIGPIGFSYLFLARKPH